MDKFKISIKGLAPDESDAVLKALWHCLADEFPVELRNSHDLCGDTISLVVRGCMPYTDIEGKQYMKTMKRIALHAYSKNLNSTVQQIEKYMLIGNGECPLCGSDQWIDYDGMGECLTCEYTWHIKEEVV